MHFLDSGNYDNSCEMIRYKYKFYNHLALKEFKQAEQCINQLSEAGYINDLGTGGWFRQDLGDSVLFAYLYKELGNEHEASTILNAARNNFENQLAEEDEVWWTYFYLSMIHAIQDEKEVSLKYLSKAADIGLMRGWHDFIEAHPIFENLWDDPQFKALVKRARDEKEAIRAQVQEMIDKGEIDL